MCVFNTHTYKYIKNMHTCVLKGGVGGRVIYLRLMEAGRVLDRPMEDEEDSPPDATVVGVVRRTFLGTLTGGGIDASAGFL